MPVIIPTYSQGFARNAAQSAFPELWRGLVGHWDPSLGPTGLTLYDWSGNKNHGTLTNMEASTDWPVTERGYANDYDGGNDFVGTNVSYTGTYFTNRLTISAWIKLNGLNNVDSIVGERGAGLGIWFYVAGNRAGDPLNFSLFGQWGQDSAATGITANTWHHVVVTYDQVSVIFYLNGKFLSSHNRADALTVSTEPLYIGALNNLGAVADVLDGQIGPVSIYSRALTANKIAATAAGASPMILARRSVGRVPVSLMAMERAISRRVASRVFGRVN